MNGNCHFIFGLTVGTMCAINLEDISTILPNIANTNSNAVLFIIGGILGGILPDMDNPKSFMAQMSEPFSKVVCKIGKMFHRGGKYHRGILHDPLVHLVGLVLAYFFCPPLVGVFVGGISHIFLDIFNPVGLPLLFGAKYISIGNIKSGGKNAILFTYTNAVIILLIGVGMRFDLFLPMVAY